MEITPSEHLVLWRKPSTIGIVRGREKRSTEYMDLLRSLSLVHPAVLMEERTAVPLVVHLSTIPTHLSTILIIIIIQIHMRIRIMIIIRICTPILTMIIVRICTPILTMIIIRICTPILTMIMVRICTPILTMIILRFRIQTISPITGMIFSMAWAVANHRHLLHRLLHHLLRHRHHHRPVGCRTTRKTTDVIPCSQHERDFYEQFYVLLSCWTKLLISVCSFFRRVSISLKNRDWFALYICLEMTIKKNHSHRLWPHIIFQNHDILEIDELYRQQKNNDILFRFSIYCSVGRYS